MSKIFHTVLINALLDLEDDAMNNRLSPEDIQIYYSLLGRENDIARRFNDLAKNVDSLSSTQLAELKELKDFEDEYNELKAQRMTTEEIQNFIDSMSSIEANMPSAGKMWLEALRKVSESRKKR